MLEDDTFRNSNLLQVEENLEVTSSSYQLSLRCPHCREIGGMASVGQYVRYAKKAHNGGLYQVTAAMRICPNAKCRGLVTVVQSNNKTISLPAETIDFDPTGIPEKILSTMKEALVCHANGADSAAAIMVRRVLEEICEDNDAKGPTLHARLEALKSKVVLPQALFAAMTELKILGNDSAHVEAKAYDSIGEAEAKLAITLAKEILKGLYQLNDLVSQLQALKKPAAAA